MERPQHLLNVETGEIDVVLVPFHLERIHGPMAALSIPPDNLPFPLLPDAEPILLTLRKGMTPEEIAMLSPLEGNSSLGERSWWRWHAYALTPFGWSAFPSLHFSSQLLYGVTFDVRGGGSTHDRMRLVLSYLERILGDPDEKLHFGWFRVRPVKVDEPADMYKWSRSWGEIAAYFEVRDREPELSITWT